MPYYRRRYNSYRPKYSYGQERALQHIREGQQLSALLGGTDETVKKYLYGLPKAQLDTILSQYEEQYGEDPANYARLTIPKWRTGTVQMSGMVAERLYQLLPPTMPLSTKYKIAEELWHHTGPSSWKAIRFGKDAFHSQIVRESEEHIVDVVQRYEIPDSLQQRFDWLTANDVGVKQDILNHLREMDKKLVIEAASLQSASMLKHLTNEDTTFTQTYTHTVSVGKHNLVLVADKDLLGSELHYDVPRQHTSKDQDYWWVIWVVVAIIIIAIVASQQE